MLNEFELSDISNELIIFNKNTFEHLLKLDNSSDCIALYTFYYYTAKWQKTNCVKANDAYIKKCLKWGNSKIQNTKKTLKESGLIDIIQRRENGKIKGWYVKISYMVTKRNLDEINVIVKTTRFYQQLSKSTSG